MRSHLPKNSYDDAMPIVKTSSILPKNSYDDAMPIVNAFSIIMPAQKMSNFRLSTIFWNFVTLFNRTWTA